MTDKAQGAFRTIGELSAELGVQQHILRYWETRFKQLKPLTRAGNRRYYRPDDVALVRQIHNLLHAEGYTVKGVQRLLNDKQSAGAVSSVSVPVAPDVASSALIIAFNADLRRIRDNLARALAA